MPGPLLRRTPLILFVIAVLSGCGENDSGQPPAPASGTSTQASGGLEDTARKAAAAVSAEAEKLAGAVTNAAGQAEAAIGKAREQADQWLAEVKSLLNARKLQDAGALLGRLGSVSLTQDQQKLMADLKTQFGNLDTQLATGLSQLKDAVAQKNLASASSLVSQVTNFQLSPEQEETLAGLKAELKKLVSSGVSAQGQKALESVLPR